MPSQRQRRPNAKRARGEDEAHCVKAHANPWRNSFAQTARKPAAKRDQVLFDGRGHGNGQIPGMAGKNDANDQPALA